MSTLPTQMRAAFIETPGPADAIRYGTLPVPGIGPADVLVLVDAVAVNAVDLFVRSGAYATPLQFPFVVGRDLVGTIAAHGPGVAGLRVGDRVWSSSMGHAGRQGAAAQYAAVAADRLYRLPADVDPVAMASIIHPAAAAYLALTLHARLTAGETVLVAGAAGHVGRAATVLAHRAGAPVIATAGAADLQAWLHLGADVAVDYRDPALPRLLEDAAPSGIDVHLDTSGRPDLDKAVGLLAMRGRIILMAGLTARSILPVGRFYTRDAEIRGFAISNAGVADLAAAAERLNQLVADGSLTPQRIEELPLQAAAEAHRRLENGQGRDVRLVLRPPPTRCR